MGVRQRKCTYCFKTSTCPCETQKQADRCPRNKTKINKRFVKQNRMKIKHILIGGLFAILFLSVLLSGCSTNRISVKELEMRATYKDRNPNHQDTVIIEKWMFSEKN